MRVRRFETLSRQDFFQFLVVGLVCGMIWWVLPLVAGGLSFCRWPAVPAAVEGLCRTKAGQVSQLLVVGCV